MITTIEGGLIAEGKKFALVVSRFNELITRKLLEGAQDMILRSGGSEKDVTIVWVPGSYEVPLVCQKLAVSKKYDAVIALAAVIRGATPHFEYVSGEIAKGVAQVSLATNVPVIFGVITAESLEQAIERAGTKGGNKGADAARSAIEMANVCGLI